MTFIALDPFVESRVDAFEASLFHARETDLCQFLPPPNHEKYLLVLVELLRVDLDLAWSRGEQRLVADYRASFPEIFQDAEALQQIAFEEFRLSREAGLRPDPELYQRQYQINTDHWSVPNDYDTKPVVGDVTRKDDEHQWSAPVPTVGGRWYGFQIVELLGRGTFGKTFRAQQTALANRDVVLKFSRLNQREAWRLAQLQHTHIVPVLSVHEYGDHCAICMPYLGRRTLADVLAEAPAEPANNGDRVSGALQLALRLADALDHSHRRGVLHADVKPANILIAEDGQPLLFDFNLAVDTNLPGNDRVQGGTLGYMAPEQLQCWLGDDVEVDHRADIYALGVVLYQLLTGRLPWHLEGECDARIVLANRWLTSPTASGIYPVVSPAVRAILSKCMACSPAERYESAAALRDDIRRHLDDLPLAVAKNDSMGELCRKWMRRHPRLVSATTVGFVALLICIALLTIWLIREAKHRPVAAAQALHAFTADLGELRADFVVASFVPDWADELTVEAENMLTRFALNDPNQVQRTLHLMDDKQCLEWRQNASSLAYMLSNLRYFSALRESVPQGRIQQLRSSLANIELASELAASETMSVALQNRRRQILDALAGLEDHPSSSAELIPGPLPPAVSVDARTAPATAGIADGSDSHSWYDRLFLGLQASDDLDLVAAEGHFRAATRLNPADATSWLLLGDVLRKKHEYEPAAAAFDVASSLSRDSTGAIFQRGLCWLAAGKSNRAIDDFTAVIQRRPDLDSPRLNRALAYLGQERHELALADLNAAMEDGCRESRAYFLRSRVHQKLGHAREALADLQAGLQQTPVDAISWIARGVARMNSDPQAALADFESALKLDPTASEARHNQAHVHAEILDQPQRAIEALNSCLKYDANDTMALAGRGVLRARMGLTESALKDAEQLLKLPLDAITRYQAACIYALCAPEDAKLEDRALGVLAESLRQDPQLAIVLENDPDLNAVHDGSEFRKIVSAIGVLRERESAGKLPGLQGESR